MVMNSRLSESTAEGDVDASLFEYFSHHAIIVWMRTYMLSDKIYSYHNLFAQCCCFTMEDQTHEKETNSIKDFHQTPQ